MKYVLLIYLDDLAWSETEREACYVESTQLAQQIHASGAVSGRQPVTPNINGDHGSYFLIDVVSQDRGEWRPRYSYPG